MANQRMDLPDSLYINGVQVTPGGGGGGGPVASYQFKVDDIPVNHNSTTEVYEFPMPDSSHLGISCKYELICYEGNQRATVVGLSNFSAVSDNTGVIDNQTQGAYRTADVNGTGLSFDIWLEKDEPNNKVYIHVVESDSLTAPTITINLIISNLNLPETSVTGVTGTGVAGQVAYWDGVSSIAGSTGFIFDAGGTTLVVGPNTVTGAYSLVSGHTSTVNGNENLVSGLGHLITGIQNAVSGQTHTINGNRNVAGGDSHNVNGNDNADFGYGVSHVGSYGLSFGYNINNYGDYNIVGGNTITVYSGGYQANAVFGAGNSCRGSFNIMTGNGGGAEVTGSYNARFGNSNTVGGDLNVVGGLSNSVSGNANAVFGSSNSNRDFGNNIISGASNSVGGNAGYNIAVGLSNYLDGTRMAVFGESHVVVGSYNIVAGYDHNSINGDGLAVFGSQHIAIGGSNNLVAGSGHTVGASNSLVVGVNNNIGANAPWSIVGGLDNTLTTASVSFVFGQNHTSDADYSFIAGGQYNQTHANGSVAMGYQTKTRISAQFAQSFGQYNGGFNDQQTSVFTAGVSTTDNTPTEIFVDLDFASQYITTQDNRLYVFKVRIVGRNSAAQEAAIYDLEFGFDRGANAASSRLLGLTKAIVYEDVASWDVNVTADTTNGRPNISVTGETSKTIYWYARIEMTEV